MTARITTAAELDALPSGSVVRWAHNGCIWEKEGAHDWVSIGNMCRYQSEHLAHFLTEIIYRPDAIPGQNLQALPDDARMDAYYYGFDRTGVGLVDAILSAVATAGKGSHHTESWGDDSGDYYRGRPGLPDADSAVDLIQRTANRSADQIRAAMGALPGQDPGEPYPTAEQIADTLIRYETSGCCQFGRTCGLCDCGRSDETPEQTQTRDAMELDRARAVLALFPPQRCAPSEDEVARAIVRASGLEWHFNPDDPEDTYRCDARAVLVLLGDQPTVTQAKAEGIREACDHVAGMLARQDADAPFSIRVTDLLEALARQVESGAEHG